MINASAQITFLPRSQRIITLHHVISMQKFHLILNLNGKAHTLLYAGILTILDLHQPSKDAYHFSFNLLSGILTILDLHQPSKDAYDQNQCASGFAQQPILEHS
jgi:hypothetical protein